MKRRYLSTAQVSQALGVSVTTVKRWVDEGVLQAHRTAGGHRKILCHDVLRLVHQENWPHIDLTLLTGPISPLNTTQLAEHLYEALNADDVRTARSLLNKAHQSGVSVDRLADQVVAPAMARIGHDWVEGQLDVVQEHRCTQACLAALLSLRERLEENGKGDLPMAIGGAPEHDHYQLPSLLAQMVLLDNGWNAVNIGPHTPLRSFRQTLRESRPALLWLSCSYLHDLESFLTEYTQLHGEAEELGTTIVLGGRALTEPIRERLPFANCGNHLGQLAADARALKRKALAANNTPVTPNTEETTLLRRSG